MIKRFIEGFVKRAQIKQTTRALQKLSDRELRDIGICRNEIDYYACM